MEDNLKDVPEFQNEAEERTFWESPENDSSEVVDWSRARVVTFPALRRPIQAFRTSTSVE
jgi:hypothetical protein